MFCRQLTLCLMVVAGFSGAAAGLLTSPDRAAPSPAAAPSVVTELASGGDVVFELTASDSDSRLQQPSVSVRKTANQTTANQAPGGHYLGCNRSYNLPINFRGYIQSSNYPYYYPSTHYCHYLLRAPRGQKLELTCDNFSLQSSMNCKFDHFYIRGVGSICGIKRFHVRRDDYLQMTFETDHTISSSGYQCSVKAIY